VLSLKSATHVSAAAVGSSVSGRRRSRRGAANATPLDSRSGSRSWRGAILTPDEVSLFPHHEINFDRARDIVRNLRHRLFAPLATWNMASGVILGSDMILCVRCRLLQLPVREGGGRAHSISGARGRYGHLPFVDSRFSQVLVFILFVLFASLASWN